jgi:uncharacterized protein with FMN-binding domain
MKKTTLSFWFVGASVAYIVYLYFIGPSGSAVAVVPATQVAGTSSGTDPLAVQTSSATDAGATPMSAPPPAKPTSTPTSTPIPTSTPTPVSTPKPTPKPAGQYADGTYTGTAADAYYGTVQVKAVVSGGKLTAVNFLQYPSDRRTSQNISAHAMPILSSEAIQAQSANVNAVSGATETSAAFNQSLASALSQAKA